MTTISDAYNSGDIDDLDKMAHQVNEVKRRKQLIDSVHKDRLADRENAKKIANRINMNNNPHYQFFSAQGDVSTDKELLQYTEPEQSVNLSYNPSQLTTEFERDKAVFKKKKHKQPDDIASIIKNIHDSHHGNSTINSNDSIDDIINHVKSCSKCKNKLKNTIGKKSKHIFNNDSDDNYDKYNKHHKEHLQDPVNNNIFGLDTRSILIIILIIVVSVLFIDVIRNK